MIVEDVLDRTQPTSGTIASASNLIPKPKEAESTEESVPTPSKKTRSGLSKAEDELLPNLICAPGTEIRWFEWPEKNYPDGSTPQEISRHSLDASFQLESLAGSDPSG